MINNHFLGYPQMTSLTARIAHSLASGSECCGGGLGWTTSHTVLVIDTASHVVVVNIACGVSLTRLGLFRLAKGLRSLHYVHLGG